MLYLTGDRVKKPLHSRCSIDLGAMAERDAKHLPQKGKVAAYATFSPDGPCLTSHVPLALGRKPLLFSRRLTNLAVPTEAARHQAQITCIFATGALAQAATYTLAHESRRICQLQINCGVTPAS